MTAKALTFHIEFDLPSSTTSLGNIFLLPQAVRADRGFVITEFLRVRYDLPAKVFNTIDAADGNFLHVYLASRDLTAAEVDEATGLTIGNPAIIDVYRVANSQVGTAASNQLINDTLATHYLGVDAEGPTVPGSFINVNIENNFTLASSKIGIEITYRQFLADKSRLEAQLAGLVAATAS